MPNSFVNGVLNCAICQHLVAKRFWRSKFLGRPRLLVEKRWPGLPAGVPRALTLSQIPSIRSVCTQILSLYAHKYFRSVCTQILWCMAQLQISTPGRASVRNAGECDGILIQMWNLAGSVTNGCDDVWGTQPANFFFTSGGASLAFCTLSSINEHTLVTNFIFWFYIKLLSFKLG